jgi:hypothetical protein
MAMQQLDVQSVDFAAGEKPELRGVPDRPGVYLYRDGDGRVLYVGKARSLRSRIRNYFGAPSGLETRTQALMVAARRVEWVVTSGEVQALMLEFSLIQEHKARPQAPRRPLLRALPEHVCDPRDRRPAHARLPDALVLGDALQRVQTPRAPLSLLPHRTLSGAVRRRSDRRGLP